MRKFFFTPKTNRFDIALITFVLVLFFYFDGVLSTIIGIITIIVGSVFSAIQEKKLDNGQ